MLFYIKKEKIQQKEDNSLQVKYVITEMSQKRQQLKTK